MLVNWRVWVRWTREHCPPDFADWIIKQSDSYLCPECAQDGLPTREELQTQQDDMRTWDNLTLARRWAESAWLAGNLFDWAKHYLPDRDQYTMHMCFNEACLEEMERRAGRCG